jgi:hypothetical protein
LLVLVYELLFWFCACKLDVRDCERLGMLIDGAVRAGACRAEGEAAGSEEEGVGAAEGGRTVDGARDAGGGTREAGEEKKDCLAPCD